jgi:hypothetical protein
MDDHEDRIRRRAYHLWEEAGRPEGRSDEFWHAARAEIAEEEALEAAPAIPRGDARRVGDFGSTSPPMRAG